MALKKNLNTRFGVDAQYHSLDLATFVVSADRVQASMQSFVSEEAKKQKKKEALHTEVIDFTAEESQAIIAYAKNGGEASLFGFLYKTLKQKTEWKDATDC